MFLNQPGRSTKYMSRLLEIESKYIKDLFLFFSEEYVRMFRYKFDKDKFESVLSERIEFQIKSRVVIDDISVIVHSTHDVAKRRDSVLSGILEGVEIEHDPVYVTLYYKISRGLDITEIKACVK